MSLQKRFYKLWYFIVQIHCFLKCRKGMNLPFGAKGCCTCLNITVSWYFDGKPCYVSIERIGATTERFQIILAQISLLQIGIVSLLFLFFLSSGERHIHFFFFFSLSHLNLSSQYFCCKMLPATTWLSSCNKNSLHPSSDANSCVD